MIQMELGQSATLRGLEILNNLGCDIRILQMEGAKDPDEFVIKYGNGRFSKLIDEAISLVEFKVKILKNSLNLESVNDKIKFLNEIAKILSFVTNRMEQEVYIDKISREYNISKEAIYAEINKLNHARNPGKKIIEDRTVRKIETKKEEIPNTLIKRENIIIGLLLTGKEEVFKQVKNTLSSDDFKSESNKKIIKCLYEEFEKGNINTNNILEKFNDDGEVISRLTEIMADDSEIKDDKKAVIDLLNNYQKEKMQTRKKEIIDKMKDANEEEVKQLEKELQELIVKLSKIK